MLVQRSIELNTQGRGTYAITDQIGDLVSGSGIQTGLCHLFLQHTSASLILCENADPDVMHDLEAFMLRQIPDGDPIYHHTMEGADDMPAHVRSILTGCELTLPISQRRCALGTWQGVYLWEHRHHAHQRRIVITIHGE